MEKAEDASRLLNHNYLGTEHLLLGLVADPETVSARALAVHGLDMAAIHTVVVEIVGQGVKGSSPVPLPLTPRAKGAFEYSLRESLKLGRNYVATEAILLGLIRMGEGIAAQVLTQLGVNLEGMRVTVMELIGIHPESGEPVSGFLWGGEEAGAGNLRTLAGNAFDRSSRHVDSRVSHGPCQAHHLHQLQNDGRCLLRLTPSSSLTRPDV